MQSQVHVFGEPCVPFARDNGNDIFLADGNWFCKFLGNAGFYLIPRKPIVQLDVVSGYLDSLRLNSGHLGIWLYSLCSGNEWEERHERVACLIFWHQSSQEVSGSPLKRELLLISWDGVGPLGGLRGEDTHITWGSQEMSAHSLAARLPISSCLVAPLSLSAILLHQRKLSYSIRNSLFSKLGTLC